MNKEDILQRSRNENKQRDLYATYVQINAGHISALCALSLSTLFFVVQSLLGLGFNYGLYAIVLSFGAVRYTVIALRMRRKRDIVLAAVQMIATVVLSAIHIASLLSPHA